MIGAKKMTCQFQAVPSLTLQNLVAQAIWFPGFLHSWYKGVWGCVGTATLILNMSITLMWVVIVTPGPLLRRENALCRHWIRDCVGSKVGLNALKARQSFRTSRESDNDFSVFQSLHWLSYSGPLTWLQNQGMECITFFSWRQPLAGQGLPII